ncbi:MAG: hypothetical protein AAGF73_18880 [Actinomycetota bacterium]
MTTCAAFQRRGSAAMHSTALGGGGAVVVVSAVVDGTDGDIAGDIADVAGVGATVTSVVGGDPSGVVAVVARAHGRGRRAHIIR